LGYIFIGERRGRRAEGGGRGAGVGRRGWGLGAQGWRGGDRGAGAVGAKGDPKAGAGGGWGVGAQGTQGPRGLFEETVLKRI